MEVERLGDAAAFLEEAEPLLLRDEARHNLMLGIAGTLRDDPGVYAEHRLWLVRDGGEVVGAALRTPPFNLVVAEPAAGGAVEALAEAIDDDPPGVTAARPEVETFAEAWATKTGCSLRTRMAQGVYALHRVQPVPAPAGAMRTATQADRGLLVEWLKAFVDEAIGHRAVGEDIAGLVDHRLSAEGTGFVLWEDDVPVSLAGFGGATPNGIRVGPVYTPPELRGRGYASALVAELSAHLLAEGRTFCFLYTDLTNPTSNRIYERIGYERVCDSAEMMFER
jgi:predicted GNAT family acetyltransferase